MIKKFIKLDGEINSIVVEIMNSGKYFHDRNNHTFNFTNLEAAKLRKKKYIPNLDVRYIFNINNRLIPLEDTVKSYGLYQYIDIDNDTIYLIEETKMVKTLTLGYLVHSDGDSVRSDKKNGNTNVKGFLNCVRYTSGILNTYGTLINKIFYNNKEYILYAKDSSVRIHILSNSKLMDINQVKISKNEKVFPFKKEMDKYTTLYIYSTILEEDPNQKEAEELARNIISSLCDEIEYSEELPKFKYVDSQYKYITFDEEVK